MLLCVPAERRRTPGAFGMWSRPGTVCVSLPFFFAKGAYGKYGRAKDGCDTAAITCAYYATSEIVEYFGKRKVVERC